MYDFGCRLEAARTSYEVIHHAPSPCSTAVSPGAGLGGGQGRRINSVEDLNNLLLRHLRGDMASTASEQGNGVPNTALKPCAEEGCSSEEEHGSKDLAMSVSGTLEAMPTPFIDVPAPVATSRESSPPTRPPSSFGAPSPLATSPIRSSVFQGLFVPGPGSAISALSGGSSPPSTSQSPRGQLRGLSLSDSRRNSTDLGHVAPSSSHMAQGHAAEELFYRLNHARQTVDYVKRQAAAFSSLSRGSMDVWEALDLLTTLREYEAALLGSEVCDPDMPLKDHALQTAEACRLAFPEHEWMAVVGLVHGLGKLLAHTDFGGEPQWAVCGESFPVGCRFHGAIIHSQFFQANPDRRRRAYATPTGVYSPGCGLSSVCMSWSGAEYLYMVLAMNRTQLPPEALFLLRYQKFGALLRPGQPYGELLSPFDRSMLPTLAKFRELSMYRRREVPGALEGEALKAHYDMLLAKYIPQGKLRW